MIKNKKIVIFGLGKEGISAANFLGRDNKITVVDKKTKKDLKKSLGEIKHQFVFFQQDEPNLNAKFDLVVRSPGIRPDHPLIEKFKNNGAQVTSVIKIFFDECSATIIGVTGTKGKGTTSTLILKMLQAQGEDAYIAGNIGLSALDILPKLTGKSFVVLELSSFQLMDLTKSPHVAVILMITREHLDWHADPDEYVSAKESIVKFQDAKDYSVINQDFPNSKSFVEKTKAKAFFVSTRQETNGVFLNGAKIISNIKSNGEEIIDTKDILLPGKHNLQNALSATAAAQLLGVSTSNITSVLKTFKGLEHRLEQVGEVAGIKFYNDSFSTTPETTIAAIEAFKEPKILIVGGSSKNADFANLGQKIASDDSIKTLVVIGNEAKRITEAVSKDSNFKGTIIENLTDMRSVVGKSYEAAQNGYVVILSPGCASFDMFKDYRDRGEQFKKEVSKLK